MAIAFVRDLGISQVSAGNPTITIGAAGATLGDHIIVLYGCSGVGSIAITSIVDTGGNTYQVDRIQDDNVAGVHIAICSAKITTGLVNGNTIVVTATGGNTERSAIALEYSGIAASSWLDRASSAGTTSTTPSSGNIDTTAAGELLIGGCSLAATNNNYAPAATVGGTPTERRDIQIGAVTKSIIAMDLVLGAAGAYAANGTSSNSAG
jgi:hypothetical protein